MFGVATIHIMDMFGVATIHIMGRAKQDSRYKMNEVMKVTINSIRHQYRYSALPEFYLIQPSKLVSRRELDHGVPRDANSRST
jgi:S-adenosylmethionine hydrolase